MGVEMAEKGAWAAIARKDAAVEPKVDIPSLLSVAGLKTVVVDTNAIIGGGIKLDGIADQFFTVREVLDEVRDPVSRFHLATLPVTIRCLEPSDEALAAVIKFSRATGDYQSLSPVDLKLIALAYTLEVEAHGTGHIRARPPPLLVTPSSTHRQKDPPGWGTVSNAEEWEGIDEEENAEAESKSKSRILGLKTLNLNFESSQVRGAGDSEKAFRETESSISSSFGHETPLLENLENLYVSTSQDDSHCSIPHESPSTSAGDKDFGTLAQTTKFSTGQLKESKKLSKIPEGKLNVAEGVDASKGKIDVDGDDWQRASCRTTRRNFLKRQARREARKQAAESANAELPYDARDESNKSGAAESNQAQVEGVHISRVGFQSGSALAKLDVSEKKTETCIEGEDNCNEDLDGEDIRLLEDDEDDGECILDDIASNGDDALSLQTDGVESEQSWMLAPLWKSSIALMTGDYAMQNVILQIGLRLLSTTGMHIRELNKWVLKCQACNRITSDIGRIFCPKCGNGGTLFKLSVTVGQNGTVHAGRNRRINLRGTRYSLPMPKGGREGALQNPILREDQLPNKFLNPKAKKTTDLDSYTSSDVIFTLPHEKKGQKLAGVRTAAAIFGGRRNPNERRGARNH